MKTGHLVTVVFDFIELVLTWLVIWIAVFVFVAAGVAATLGKDHWFESQTPLVSALLLTLYGMAASAAMVDLALRIKGTKTLFERFKASRTTDAISSAVDAGENHVALLFVRIAKVVGLLLLIALFCAAAYLLFAGVAALPISVAIIIGAVIIAMAIKYS